VFTADMILQKLNYIHNNPLQEKWQLSKTAEDYRYSSAGFYRFNTEGLIKTEVFTKYFDVPVAKSSLFGGCEHPSVIRERAPSWGRKFWNLMLFGVLTFN
jgi:hypothetical protein